MNPAGITISELLRLPVLKDAKVISGENGLNRIVRFIDIMEVPDVKGWLREGELLLTTAYSIRDDPALLPKLVEQLAQADAAALAIKPDRFIHDLPSEMIQTSNAYNLPIIQLPSGIPYMDITHAVMEQIIDKQASLLRRSEEVYKLLTTLVLNNSGIQNVADNVALLLKSPIWLINMTGETIVSSPSNLPNNPMHHNTRYWDITVDKQFVGKLIIGKEHLDELELVCVEQARLVFSLELMRRKTALDTEKKLRGDFIEELLTGLPFSKDEIINKGHKLGFKTEGVWEIAVVETENNQIPDFIAKLDDLLKQESQKHHIKSHIHKQGERFVLLLASPIIEQSTQISQANSSTWTELLNLFSKEWSGVRIGLGEKCQLWEVQRSYIEAKKAMLIGSKMDKNHQFFTFAEIEMFQLLLDASEYVDMDKFVEKKIGKLCQYDLNNGTDLVKTFYYYLSSGGSLVETAKLLFLHRNSVKYRMDRIREISGIDFDNFRERFMYYFCIFHYLYKNS
jgi:purine catabolism regulator